MRPNGTGASDGSDTTPLLQGSFTSGELAPALYARTDLAKFHSGAKFLRNFFVQAQGGVVNRAGTRFCGHSAGGDATVRLIPFSFNLTQTYALVLTDSLIQLVTDGGFVTEDGTGATPPISIVTPYAAADLFDITFCQSADILTLCHPLYPPAQLTRQSATEWTYAPIAIGTALKPPAVTLLHGANNGYPDGDSNVLVLDTPFEYGVTACALNPPSESLLSNTLSCVNYDLSFSNYGVFNDLYFVPPAGQKADYYNVYRLFEGAWSFCASTVGKLATGGNGETGGVLALNWRDQDVTPDTNIAPPQNTNPFYDSTFTGSISGTVLSITGWDQGTLAAGDQIAANGALPDTTVTGVLTGASFSGSISGTILTVTSESLGALATGADLFGPGIPAGVTINSAGSGGSGGGAGTWGMSASNYAPAAPMLALAGGSATFVVAPSQTVASEAMTTTTGSFTASIAGTVMTVTGLAGGLLEAGEVVTGAGVSSGTTIASCLTGSSFTGVLSGQMLTVESTALGTLAVGNAVVGPKVSNPTSVVSQGTAGTGGGDGTYVLSASLTIPVQGMLAAPGGAATFTVNQAQTVASGPMTGGIEYPAACAYFQQRAMFGGSDATPQGIWASQTANYDNFNTRQPLLASDAITLQISANTVNQIRHFVSLNDLIVFTNAGAWKLSGQSNSGDVITPSNVVCVPQAYSGCSNVPPIVISPNIVYVQEKGAAVRELSYNVYTNLYTGEDISVLSDHLFRGYQLVDWCFAREPWKIVWATRNDGTLLGLTYLKEQDVAAWHHHDTAPTTAGGTYPGTFVSCCSISEGSEDVVYLAVRRFLNGAWTRTIERMQSRVLGAGDSDITAAWFVDCGLQYSGAPTKTITGLNHLYGQTVAILADGAVKSPQVVQWDGASTYFITLPVAASVVTVGLPITAQMETLPLDAGTPTVQGKRKRVTKVRLFMYNTRGLKVGPALYTGPQLEEIKPRFYENWGQVPALYTGQSEDVHIPGNWDTYGSLWVQQDYPLPATLLGIEPWVSVGE